MRIEYRYVLHAGKCATSYDTTSSSTIGTVTPPYHMVNIGSEVTITCWSYEPAEWYFKDSLLKSSLKINFINNVLVIKMISISDEGMYECFGTYENNRVFFIGSALFVKSESIQW